MRVFKIGFTRDVKFPNDKIKIPRKKNCTTNIFINVKCNSNIPYNKLNMGFEVKHIVIKEMQHDDCLNSDVTNTCSDCVVVLVYY